MEKNVIVVDENGNEYGATWPKRARGLVKSGRARFIDENRICLACPPILNEITEDIEMSENKKIEATEVAETTEIAEATETAVNTATKYTLDYVLEQIAKIQQHIAENPLNHLRYSVGSIYANDVKDSTCEDDSDSFNGEESRNGSVACVCEIFRYREETLKQMLAFYERMYDDLRPKPVDPVNEATKRVVTAFISSRADYIAGVDGGVTTETFEGIMSEIQNARYLAENK